VSRADMKYPTVAYNEWRVFLLLACEAFRSQKTQEYYFATVEDTHLI